MNDVQPPDPDPTARFIATHIARTAKKNPPQVDDLAWAISEVTLETQMAGASLLTVPLADPQWSLVTSGFLDVNEDGLLDEIDVEFPEGSGSWWRICMAQVDSVSDSPNVTLTFEDRIVSYLRDKWGAKVISPGATTRAQVVKTLVDEVGHGDGLQPIKFVCPSLNVEQPIAVPSPTGSGTITIAPGARTADTRRKTNKSRGIGHGAAVTIKGQTPTATQLRLINDVLDIAQKLYAGTLPTLALLEACIQENDFTNNPGGGGGSTGLLQLIPSTAQMLGVNPLDVRQTVTAFLVRSQGGVIGGAIAYARQHPNASPDQVAQAVQASGAGASKYAQWESEARTILAAYGGVRSGTQPVGAAGTAPTVAAVSDVGQLTRGTSDNPDESSWDCITRLAADVQWYAFSNADTLYYLDGPDLLAQRPSAYLRFAPGIGGQLDWLLIDGPTGEKSTGVVKELVGTFDNTAYVYRSTHRRKGKVMHRSRIAKPQTPSEIQLGLICEIDYLRAGDVVVIQDAGPINGRWVIADATRNCLADTHTQFTLAPPQAPTPEPQASDTAITAAGGPAAVSPASTAPTPSGYFNPFAKARNLRPGRIDAGVDYTMTPGDEIVCIGDSRVIGINQNWYESQPLLCMQFTAGPNNGEYWYIAEYIGNLPSIGSLIRGGDRLCTFGGAGSTGQQSIEIGWASPTSHIQVQTGGDSERTAGDNFARFLRSLGCRTVAIASGTKGSTHNPVGAARG